MDLRGLNKEWSGFTDSDIRSVKNKASNLKNDHPEPPTSTPPLERIDNIPRNHTPRVSSSSSSGEKKQPEVQGSDDSTSCRKEEKQCDHDERCVESAEKDSKEER